MKSSNTSNLNESNRSRSSIIINPDRDHGNDIITATRIVKVQCRNTSPLMSIPTASSNQQLRAQEVNRLKRNRLACLLDEALLISTKIGPIRMNRDGSNCSGVYASDRDK